MKAKQCKKCDHEWFPRTENTQECPCCKTRKWNGEIFVKEGVKKDVL